MRPAADGDQRSQWRGDTAADQGCRRAARQTQPAKASHPGKRNPQHRGEHRAAARFKVCRPALTRPRADIVLTWLMTQPGAYPVVPGYSTSRVAGSNPKRGWGLSFSGDLKASLITGLCFER